MERMTLSACLKRAGFENSFLREYEKDENYTREGEVHCTSSAFLCNKSLDKVLFVYHNIYDSYTWPGGHNDGERDFLQVAIREAEEETGIKNLTLYSAIPLHMGLLPVKEHVKNGKKVPAHRHLNVTFAFVADESEKIKVKEDENSDVRWLPTEALASFSSEPHMIPVFEECVRKLKEIQAEKQRVFRTIPFQLLPWYEKNKRDLPWRREKSAYRTWVSEIMLQQTRVEAGKAYFERFLRELPTVEALACCPEEKLMKLWEGLGYYNRAKNLQKTAKIIVEQYGGVFPSDAETLRSLPGIGEYTAGAISSISFEQKEPAVDGNVVRVLSRITENYDIDLKKKLFSSLRAIYPDRAGDFTQSLMELGAIVCLPNGVPLCEKCPMKKDCLGRRLEMESFLPCLPPKRERRVETLFVYHIETLEGLVLQKRKKGVLKGMWELPNFETEQELPLAGKEELGRKEFTHVFTHVEWKMTCIYVKAESAAMETHSWQEIEENLSIPSAFKKMLRKGEKM